MIKRVLMMTWFWVSENYKIKSADTVRKKDTFKISNLPECLSKDSRNIEDFRTHVDILACARGT